MVKGAPDSCIPENPLTKWLKFLPGLNEIPNLKSHTIMKIECC